MRRPPATPLVLLALQGPLALLACSRSGDGAPAAPSTSDAAGPAGAPHAVATDAATPPALVSRPPTDLNVVLITIDSLRADMPWAGYPRPIAPRLTESREAERELHARVRGLVVHFDEPRGASRGEAAGGAQARWVLLRDVPEGRPLLPRSAPSGARAHPRRRSARVLQGSHLPARVRPVDGRPGHHVQEHDRRERDLASAGGARGEASLGEGMRRAVLRLVSLHGSARPVQVARAREHPGAWGKSIRDRYDGEVTFTDSYVGSPSRLHRGAPLGSADRDHRERRPRRGVRRARPVQPRVRALGQPRARAALRSSCRARSRDASTLRRAPSTSRRRSWTSSACRASPASRGRASCPRFYGAPPNERDVVLDLPATSDSDRRRAIVHGHEKLIAFGEDRMYELFDLDADPTEEHPITKGDEFHDMVLRYRAFEKNVKDVPPYGCREGCLSRAYLKKDGGA